VNHFSFINENKLERIPKSKSYNTKKSNSTQRTNIPIKNSNNNFPNKINTLEDEKKMFRWILWGIITSIIVCLIWRKGNKHEKYLKTLKPYIDSCIQEIDKKGIRWDLQVQWDEQKVYDCIINKDLTKEDIFNIINAVYAQLKKDESIDLNSKK
jgi:hypothetical protein